MNLCVATEGSIIGFGMSSTLLKFQDKYYDYREEFLGKK